MFKCCQNKNFSNYCCVSCLNIFHPSCLERKTEWKIVDGYKIYCSEQCKTEKENQIDSNQLNDQLIRLKAEYEVKCKEIEALKAKCIEYKTKLNKEQKNSADSKTFQLSQNDIKYISQSVVKTVEPLLDRLSSTVVGSLESNNKQMADTFDSLISTISGNYTSNVDKFIESLGSIKRSVDNFEKSNHSISSELKLVKEKMQDTATPQIPIWSQAQPPSDTRISTNQVAAAVNDVLNSQHGRQDRVNKNNNNNRTTNYVINKGAASEDDHFKAANNSKMWLYIGKAAQSVSCDNIKDYLTKKLKNPTNGEFIVEKLKTVGSTNSFKVGLSMGYYDEVNSCEFWPKGITFRRFNFKKRLTGSVVTGATFEGNM